MLNKAATLCDTASAGFPGISLAGRPAHRLPWPSAGHCFMCRRSPRPGSVFPDAPLQDKDVRLTCKVCVLGRGTLPLLPPLAGKMDVSPSGRTGLSLQQFACCPIRSCTDTKAVGAALLWDEARWDNHRTMKLRRSRWNQSADSQPSSCCATTRSPGGYRNESRQPPPTRPRHQLPTPGSTKPAGRV